MIMLPEEEEDEEEDEEEVGKLFAESRLENDFILALDFWRPIFVDKLFIFVVCLPSFLTTVILFK